MKDTRAKCGICYATHPTSAAALACFDAHVERGRQRRLLDMPEWLRNRQRPLELEEGCGGDAVLDRNVQ